MAGGDALGKLAAIRRLLTIPTREEIPKLLLMLTQRAGELADEEKGELWWKLDRVLSARLCLGKFPTITVEWAPISDLFHQALAGKAFEIRRLDSRYRVTSHQALARIATIDFTHRLRYYTDYFDCENYARRFQQHCAEPHSWPRTDSESLIMFLRAGGL